MTAAARCDSRCSGTSAVSGAGLELRAAQCALRTSAPTAASGAPRLTDKHIDLASSDCLLHSCPRFRGAYCLMDYIRTRPERILLSWDSVRGERNEEARVSDLLHLPPKESPLAGCPSPSRHSDLTEVE